MVWRMALHRSHLSSLELHVQIPRHFQLRNWFDWVSLVGSNGWVASRMEDDSRKYFDCENSGGFVLDTTGFVNIRQQNYVTVRFISILTSI